MIVDYSKLEREAVILVKDIIIPTLREVDRRLLSIPAVQLLAGTCASESNLGYYRKQIKGPARGIYQIEPFTACDLIEEYLNVPKRALIYIWVIKQIPNYKIGAKFVINGDAVGNELIKNDKLSTILARIKYFQDKEEIPSNLQGIAEMWKRVYNTYLGKGNTKEFINKYNKFIGDFEEMNKLIISLY